jgi:hypothetical protein
VTAWIERRREDREHAAPMAPVQTKSMGQKPQVWLGHPGLPRAMVLRLIRDLPGDRLSCPRRPLTRRVQQPWSQHRETRSTRLGRPCRLRSSCAIIMSMAARLNVSDDAHVPLARPVAGKDAGDLHDDTSAKLFCAYPPAAHRLKTQTKLVFRRRFLAWLNDHSLA